MLFALSLGVREAKKKGQINI